MEELCRRVGKIWRVCNSRSRKNSTSHLFWLVQTLSKLFTPVPTCSHLLPPVYTCSHLFILVHTCSQLFTSQWLSTLFAQWHILVELSPRESCYVSILHAILLKMHIFAHLIESCPMLSRSRSCIKKKKNLSVWQPILQWPSMLVAKCHFLHLRMLFFFSLMFYPAEIAHFNSPNRELSHFVRLI